MSQTQQILKHLRAGRSITPAEAVEKFRCYRLAARIKDIREQYGEAAVMSELVSTDHGGFGRYARYHGVRGMLR